MHMWESGEPSADVDSDQLIWLRLWAELDFHGLSELLKRLILASVNITGQPIHTSVCVYAFVCERENILK